MSRRIGDKARLVEEPGPLLSAAGDRVLEVLCEMLST
jgi:hypothetical protein